MAELKELVSLYFNGKNASCSFDVTFNRDANEAFSLNEILAVFSHYVQNFGTKYVKTYASAKDFFKREKDITTARVLCEKEEPYNTLLFNKFFDIPYPPQC